VTSEQMRVFDPHAVVLNGLGHNPHVEAPDKFWQLLESTLQTSRPPN
jgi:pimeloyl-ACP methyl ester carboxylesterase